jgi:hypothetical protein
MKSTFFSSFLKMCWNREDIVKPQVIDTNADTERNQDRGNPIKKMVNPKEKQESGKHISSESHFKNCAVQRNFPVFFKWKPRKFRGSKE